MLTKLISSLLVLCLLTTCRYKDNDSITLRTVKNRLKGTWLLKEAIVLDSNNLDLIKRNPRIKTDTLRIIISLVGKQIVVNHYAFDYWVDCELRDHKKEIYVLDPYFKIGDLHLTITKLTHNELWMEGNPILGMCDRTVTSERLRLRYSK